MAMIIWLLPLISLFIVLISGRRYIELVEAMGLTGIDVHKKDKREVAELGGPLVSAGLLAGLFFYVAYSVYIKKGDDLLSIFAAISTILIVTLIGIFDDLGVLAKREGIKRVGLKKWQKPFLTIFAAIPLMAVKAGVSSIIIPFFGRIDLGYLYPLLLVPIGVVGASNAINMLGGFNGLEASMGAILLSFLGYYAYNSGSIVAAIIAFSTVGALVGFLFYNWYPAKIFPGDSLTYLIGSVVAVVTILGNIEKFALLTFAPWFVELFLKARSKFKAENFGKLQEDGTLKAPYKKCYSLTHCVMKIGKLKEKQVVLVLDSITFLWCIISMLLIKLL